ncbi:peptidoglycan DD-metalloendopeptidase family protein [Candidatus Gracilibacteria bacterium]|nr:peptidoglycan DD-metalloendopeptidase family protein [Candidatus Gracilibacteria bacterium]
MKKSRYIILLPLFISLTIPVVFALTSKGQMLENFKRQEKEMIFESQTIFLDEGDRNILKTYNKLNVYSSIGDKIQSKREYLEVQNEKINSRVNSLESSIIQFDKDIEELVIEVNKINEQVVSTKDEIDTNKKTIDILQSRIEESTVILLEYIVYLYKKGDYVTTDNDIDNIKSILLSGEKIDELVNDLYFKSIIQLTGQQLIEKHRDFVSRLYVKKLELQESENQLKTLRKQGILERNILDDKRSSKQRILEITKGQEELYQKYISEQLELERDIKVKELKEQIKLNNTKKKLLEKYNCEFVDIQVQQTEFSALDEQCANINKIIFAESRLSGIPLENNPLDWPVNPSLGISSYFNDTGYQRLFGTDHDAIDIMIPMRTEIRAPMDGYVVFIQPVVNTGYAYFAVKHSDGLVSLYGHVNQIDVKLYDFVKKGDVIGLTGGEYGTNGAGLLSTGPHLHFVVYDEEEYNDPLNYLNLSYLSYKSLPSKYQFKYKSDFKSRKGFEYADTSKKQSTSGSTFVIEGENELERQKYLLGTYAVGDFRNWDIWVEESIAGGIDPTFMMCVGLAETSLGKYLKSAYNIGNVGNNDRGDTKDFPNARSAIAAMTSTFNNKYLGKYNTINQLSRYGNKTGAIYASSDFNWHNNITKCMSHVKGEYIPDDYNYRISIK